MHDRRDPAARASAKRFGEAKGGTSLPKGFGLIGRISEDLDVKIEPGTDNYGAPREAARPSIHPLSEAWLSPERRPARSPSMLTSSSRSSQWIPWPVPINRQLFRSSGLPCASLGYQASGTRGVRPSLSSTLSESDVTSTLRASGTSISTLETATTILVCPSSSRQLAGVPTLAG